MKTILEFIRKIILKLLGKDHYCHKCKHWDGMYTSGRCGRFPRQAFIQSHPEWDNSGKRCIKYFTSWEYPKHDMHDSCGEFKSGLLSKRICYIRCRMIGETKEDSKEYCRID